MKTFLVDLMFGVGLVVIVVISLSILSHQRKTLGVSTDNIETNLKVVALTFDDGPSEHTQQILSILKEKNVQATFFVVGENIEHYPELVQDAYFQGHQIGNHSQSHPVMYFMNQSDILHEFAQTEEQIYELIGVRPAILRIPYGWYHQLNMWKMLETNYYQIIGWNVDPEDWKKPSPDRIVQNVIETVQPGSIILMHDGPPLSDRAATIEALPDMIDALYQKGYQFVTVGKLQELNQDHIMLKGKI